MKIKQIAALAIALGSILSSCDKNFESINIDPTKLSPANMNYNYLFTNAQLITSGNSDGNAYEDWRNNLIYASCMIQHLSSTYGYWGGDKYTYNSGYNSAYWDANYNNSIKNIVDVIENVKNKPELSNFYNIARIFKVFQFQRMTDMYGDIPYSQAGLGYTQGITTPVYDKQADIYDNMLNELKAAATALDPGAPNTIGAADRIYGGDVSKWKKFAYSEMVRIAMRLSKVDAAKAQQWVQTAYAGGVFASNDDNALFQHENQPWSPPSNGNGWVLDVVDPAAAKISLTFMTMLKSTNDPRLRYIATVATDPSNGSDMGNNDPSIQIGMPNGYDQGSGATDISHAANYPGNINNYSIVNRNTFARVTAPTFFLTYSETMLLLAEAAQRGWVSATASTLYNTGVTAAILQLNQTGASLTATDASTYLTANPYNAGTALQQINTQYYIATFMDEYEAWANWRRSGFPVLTPVNYFGNVTGGTIPRRFTYPTNEPAVNGTNYNAAVAGLSNGDKMTSRVWWDKQ
ncbi:MAG: SusD/RagB family nutrient-binding outer membrane lipoprotein [Chitinophagaceae bacterium]|nr:SusD/RagB family nutrient-binding outer membrane lipoprotein [Chitinophagaceae bacterium]